MKKIVSIILLSTLFIISCAFATVYMEPWTTNQDGNQHNLTDMDYIEANTISGALDWTDLSGYPSACPDGSTLTQLDDTVTCTDISAFVHTNDDDLVLYLSCNENTGTIAYDSSREGNDGTITDGTWTSGKFGDAINLTGNTGGVSCGSDSSINITGNITISLWLNLLDYSNDPSVVVMGDRSTNGYYLTILTSGRIKLNYYNSTDSAYAQTDASIATPGWKHIVAVRDGTSGKIYLDGADITTSSSTFMDADPSTKDLVVGGDHDLSGHVTRGKIDEVKIFSKVLTDAEIRGLYNLGLASHPPEGHLLFKDVPYGVKQRFYNSTGDICCCIYVNATGDWLRSTNATLCTE